ncbi:MAG: hypothetical protein CMM69_09455, partial [Rhodospirillaceae bacterium]
DVIPLAISEESFSAFIEDEIAGTSTNGENALTIFGVSRMTLMAGWSFSTMRCKRPSDAYT